MRCLALAQAWQDAGGRVVFAMTQVSPAVRDRLLSENMEISELETSPGSADDAGRVAALARLYAATWVVVDGYHFGGAYQRELRAAGPKVLLIDDNGHAGPYSADLVLNQNAHAGESLYRDREPYTQLLLGPRYAMLRREFASWRDWKREISPVGRKVLVTMGGSDPDNVTARVIQALNLVKTEGLEATVVVGGSNPHYETLQKAAEGFAGAIRLQRDVSNMPELMAWADVAISGAGTTCSEMCVLGLPAILIDLAENQRPIALALERRVIAIHIGGSADVTPAAIADKLEWLLFSTENRAAMSCRARLLVDGRGSGRVLSSVLSGNLRLRQIEEKDCRLLWEWANDSEVRTVSFSPEPIPWDQHLRWFHSKLADLNALLYLVTDPEETPVGEVRYQLEGTRAVVSICVGPEFRGKGYGNRILKMATEELFRSTQVKKIDAYVKPENEASLRLFASAGFTLGTTVQLGGQRAVHFVLGRNSVS
jgi:UDP-2,4-diacetamido-2,4,6-trideoxy-beta-L-altropyranose hydrolase